MGHVEPHESLGGGGTVCLRIDPQGKTLADALLTNMHLKTTFYGE